MISDSDQPAPEAHLRSQPQAAGLSRPARVVIIQPSMGKYRVPVFRELASRPNLSLRVVHATGLGVPNAPADGFEAQEQLLRRVRLLGQPFYWQAAHLRELRRDVDVMVAAWDVHYLSLLPALARARRLGIGTVLWGHGYSKNESRLRRGLRNRVGQRADALLLYNELGRRKLIEAGVAPEKIFVAPNTIDITEATAARQSWLADPQKLRAWRNQNGLSGPVLLHVARYSPQRRIEMLFDAATRILRRRPDLRIVLIGQGYDQPPVTREIERRKLGAAVLRPGAIYDEQSLAPYFLSAAAMVFPSHIGLALQHAFAYGLPVVTHGERDSQAPELEALVDRENGLLFEKGSAQDLADRLELLISDKALRDRLGAAGLEAMRTRWSLGRMVDGMVAAISFALARRPWRADSPIA